MSYKLLYYSHFYNNKNELYTLEIYKDTTDSPTAEEITIAEDGIIVDFPAIENKLDTIRSSGAEINLLARRASQFFNLYTAKIKEYKVLLKLADRIVWSGYLDTENYSEEFSSSANYNFQITANDGFKILERIPYFSAIPVDSGLEDKPIIQQMSVIAICLNAIGLTWDNVIIGCSTSITPIEGLNSTGPSIFSDTYINQLNFIDEDGNSKNCLEVLEWQLKSYGLFIQKYNNNIYILDYDTIIKNLPCVIYNSEWDYVGQQSWALFNLGEVEMRSNSSTLSVVNSFNSVNVVFNSYNQSSPAKFDLELDDLKDENYEYSEIWNNNSSSEDVRYEYFNKAAGYEKVTVDAFELTNFITRSVGMETKNADEKKLFLYVRPPVDGLWGPNYPNLHIPIFTLNSVADSQIINYTKDYYLKLDCTLKIADVVWNDIKNNIDAFARVKKIYIPFYIKVGNQWFSRSPGNPGFWSSNLSICWVLFSVKADDTTNMLNTELKNTKFLLSTDSLIETDKSFDLIHLDLAGGGALEVQLLTGYQIWGDSGDTKNVPIITDTTQNTTIRSFIKHMYFSKFNLTVTDSTGAQLEDIELVSGGTLDNNYEDEADELTIYHGTNRRIKPDGSNDLTGNYPIMPGSLMYKNSAGNYRNIKSWTKGENTNTIELLLLNSFISNYIYKTISLDATIKYDYSIVGYKTYSFLPNKILLIGGALIDYKNNIIETKLIEVTYDNS